MVTKTEEASEPIRASASKRADVSLAKFDKRKVVETPAIKRTSQAQLIAHAAKFAKRSINALAAPTMELSARHPYDPAGLIDVYKPGPLGLHLKFTIHGYDRDDRTKSWRMGGDCRVRHVQSPGERHLSSGSALLRLSDDDGAAWSRG